MPLSLFSLSNTRKPSFCLMPSFNPSQMIQSASLLADLPGFSCLRPSSIFSISLPLLILLFLPVSDGCSPSWFREERSVPSMEKTKEFKVEDLPSSSSSEDDELEDTDYIPERECDGKHSGFCAHGAGCKLHWAPLAERWDPVCTCSVGYIGHRCDEPYDKNVFAAPLEVGGRSHTSLAAMSFFAALSLVTLGAALFFYRKLMRAEEWELTETCTTNTPFSNRMNSTLHRRNAFTNTSMYSPNTTCLNPALTKKAGLNLDDSPIEIALDATITSSVSVHPSIS